MQVVCLHNHGIRPAAASTHPHADASANRPSYRRKDGVVTHTFSRFLVVPRRVSLLHCLDDYLAAGALNSSECLNNLSSIMSLPWGFRWPWCKSNFRPQHSSLPPRHRAWHLLVGPRSRPLLYSSLRFSMAYLIILSKDYNMLFTWRPNLSLVRESLIMTHH